MRPPGAMKQQIPTDGRSDAMQLNAAERERESAKTHNATRRHVHFAIQLIIEIIFRHMFVFCIPCRKRTLQKTSL